MIKTYCLFTSEVDIVETALADIKSQLPQITLLKNTVGIIACHYDHINSGVIKALAEELPFPVVGFTTFYQATPKVSGLFELTVTILTSDDVSFGIGMSIDKEAGPKERVIKAYENACIGHEDVPTLIMSFITMKRDVTGDAYIKHVDAVSGNVPNFGVVSIGDNDSGEGNFLICGSDAYAEGFAMLLFFGKVTADFHFANIKKNSILDISGKVTKSDGIVLKEVADMPAIRFIERSGVVINEYTKAGLLTMPFIFKLPGSSDSEPVFISRTLFDFNEAGEAMFFGEIPEGTEFRIATTTSEDVLATASEVVDMAVAENKDASMIFIFSCVGRYMTLGLDADTETEHIKEHMSAGLGYLITYAGGELCPVKINGSFCNTYHNQSIVACSIK